MEELGLKLVGIFGAVFLFGFAILVHELGHFLAAKFFGIGVNKFAIGFGPKIWSIVKGGTEYSVRWIPMGGFVALKGMADEEEEKPSENAAEGAEGAGLPVPPPHDAKKQKITEDLDALRNRHPLVRMAVFTSGVACNYLTAIFLTGFMLWHGIPQLLPLPPVVADVPAESRFYQQGWRSGDRVVSVAGKPVADWEQMNELLFGTKSDKGVFRAEDLKAQNPPEEAARLTVAREGTTLSLPLSPALLKKEPEIFRPALPAVVAAVEPNSPADRAKLLKDNYAPGTPVRPMPADSEMKNEPLRGGDRILAINDQPVAAWHEMQKLLQANPNAPVTLTVERADGASTRVMKLAAVLEDTGGENPKGRLGIIAGLPEQSGEREREPFLKAFALAPVRTAQMTVFLVVETVDFLKEASWLQTKRNLGSQVAIGVMAYRSARKGLDDYLNLFIAISIILAVMNVLPIPVLDGGYIAITFIELIIRRPIPQRVLAPVLTTFMFLFIILFTLIFYNDFRNWVFKQ